MLRTLCFAAVLAAAVPAAAQNLVSSTPAANSTARSPASIELRFDAPVTTAGANIQVVQSVRIPGEGEGSMLVSGVTVKPGATPQAILLALETPLTPGSYRVDYSVAMTDGRRASGWMNFKAN